LPVVDIRTRPIPVVFATPLLLASSGYPRPSYASRDLQAPQIVPGGPQESRRASRHLQAPQIVPRGPQESRRASRHLQESCLEALRSRAGPPEPPPPLCFRSSSKTARSCCLPVVDPRTASPVSMPAVAPWAPCPSSKTQARVKACVGQLTARIHLVGRRS
jgi:hypothetical protein